jgi:hypothetical protein
MPERFWTAQCVSESQTSMPPAAIENLSWYIPKLGESTVSIEFGISASMAFEGW